MNINLMPLTVFWGILALAVVSLILYRRSITSHEDDSIHLEGSVPAEQVALDHRLAVVDRWGKTLTVIAVVYGLALAGVYVYQLWNNVPSY
jgi:heme/copper-type cytochrome/quinol oxidase subunit 2